MTRSTRARARAAATATFVFALLVAVLPPSAHYLLSYQYLLGHLDSQAELSARTVTGLVMANPRTWQFEEVRLSELLQRRPLTRDPQVRRVVDPEGNLVAQYGDSVPRPLVVRSSAVFDAGVVVGRAEVAQSLRPILVASARIAAVSLLAGGLLYLFLGVFPRRLTDRALASLEESEQRYRALYRSMREGMALFRAEGDAGDNPSLTLLDANPALEAMLGVSAEELAGTDGGAFLGSAVRQHLASLPDTGPRDGRLTFEASPAGQDRVFSVSVFRPAPNLVAALLEDVSEIRKAREERKQLEHQMLETQKLESLGVLAGGIAHDFNNLLVGILGNVDLALAKATPESVLRPYLRKIETAGQRAADLTNQMLAYSGRGRFVVEAIDASRLVEEMGHLLATVVSKNAQVRYDLPAGLPPVEADATQLRQVVMNLITNASDAIGGRDGVITVSTSAVVADRGYLKGFFLGESLPEGRYVLIEVSDTGCGMTPETRDRIFEPFFTTKQKGRGLGLAAALGIIRAHRGALSVRSEPGEGTTFRLLLPAAAAAGGEAATRPAARTAGPSQGAGAGTILVVDDEEEVLLLARDLLEGHGFAVLTALDGVKGVELFREHHAELSAVILDLTMPRMGGAEACAAMHEIAPDVPVVLCSGYSDTEASLLARPAAGFVQKPYRVQTLLTTVARVIGERKTGPSGA